MCLFPTRSQAVERPIPGDYFVHAGDHLRKSIQAQGPAIRREASQMELGLEQPKKATRG